MSTDILFQVVNLVVLPFWALMIFAPAWLLTRRVMESLVVPGLFAALYAALILPALPAVFPLLLKPDLAVISAELARPQGFVVAWIHFLTFDLFVGRWEYLDARERGISAWLTGPCLFLTLLFGPLGFLSYLAIRTIARKKGYAETA